MSSACLLKLASRWSSFAFLAVACVATWSRAEEGWTPERRAEIAAKAATVDTAVFVYRDFASIGSSQYPEHVQAKLKEIPEAAEGLQQEQELFEKYAKLKIREQLTAMDYRDFFFPGTYDRYRTEGDAKQAVEQLAAERREEHNLFPARDEADPANLEPDEPVEESSIPKASDLLEGKDSDPLRSGVEGDEFWIVQEFCCSEDRPETDPKAAKNVQAGFAAVKDFPIVLLLSPGEKFRERLPQMAEAVPPFVKPLVEERLAKDLAWLAVGYDPREGGKIEVRGAASDADAAQRIREDWQKLLDAGLAFGRESGFFEGAGVDPAVMEEGAGLLKLKGEGASLELALALDDPKAVAAIDAAIACFKASAPTPAE